VDILQLDTFKLTRVAEKDCDFHGHATLADETTNCQHCCKYGVVGFGRREQISKPFPSALWKTVLYILQLQVIPTTALKLSLF